MTTSDLPGSDAAATFSALLSRFRAPRPSTKAGTGISTDTIIGARIRPLLPAESAEGLVSGAIVRPKQNNVVDLHELKQSLRGGSTLNSFNFSLDRAYGPDDTTEAVYDDLVAPLLPFAWGGGIGTLFAYGQTGSGKTFTVSGIEKIVASKLFDGSFPGNRQVRVCIFELAGNSAYNLLNDRKPIQVVEDTLREIQLLGASEFQADTSSEMKALIDRATSFRRTASTQKNDSSSRSHAVCRITIRNSDDEAAPEGVLYIIDLAGSEAARDVAAHGADRMRETREINASLAVLKECIRGRAQLDAGAARNAKKIFIPFRQSALTKALKHVFDPEAGRACRTSVIACVNPSFLDVTPSKNTLRYAEMLRVAIPKAEPLQIDRNIPRTWTNEMVKTWIATNSGTPAIDPNILAPFETGLQLIRMPESEFRSRCVQCPGVSDLRAKAFYTKFWSKHIDSKGTNSGPKPPKLATSSIAKQSERLNVSFKERIHPGMVVSFKPLWHSDARINMAVVLCPEWASGLNGNDPLRERNDVAVQERTANYLCALVQPGSMANAYTVALWTQTLISLEDMKEEVLLEYDPASRFYYLQV